MALGPLISSSRGGECLAVDWASGPLPQSIKRHSKSDNESTANNGLSGLLVTEVLGMHFHRPAALVVVVVAASERVSLLVGHPLDSIPR